MSIGADVELSPGELLDKVLDLLGGELFLLRGICADLECRHRFAGNSNRNFITFCLQRSHQKTEDGNKRKAPLFMLCRV